MQDGINGLVYRHLTSSGYGSQNPGYQPRHALLRLKDGRLLSGLYLNFVERIIVGCGGDVEVLSLEETQRAMDTGQLVRVTSVTVFGSKDVVKGIKTLPSCGSFYQKVL